MKFTLNWLKDHLDTKATPAEIEEALTQLGLEVDFCEQVHIGGCSMIGSSRASRPSCWTSFTSAT